MRKGRLVYSTDPTPQAKRKKSATKEVPAAEQSIYVERSRKGRKGKTVTIISGFQHPPATLKKLLKQFKGSCGAGGTIKGNTLEVQGDHRDKLIETLKKMGYKVKQKGG